MFYFMSLIFHFDRRLCRNMKVFPRYISPFDSPFERKFFPNGKYNKIWEYYSVILVYIGIF